MGHLCHSGLAQKYVTLWPEILLGSFKRRTLAFSGSRAFGLRPALLLVACAERLTLPYRTTGAPVAPGVAGADNSGR
jgi:hypothetical protein